MPHPDAPIPPDVRDAIVSQSLSTFDVARFRAEFREYAYPSDGIYRDVDGAPLADIDDEDVF